MYICVHNSFFLRIFIPAWHAQGGLHLTVLMLPNAMKVVSFVWQYSCLLGVVRVVSFIGLYSCLLDVVRVVSFAWQYSSLLVGVRVVSFLGYIHGCLVYWGWPLFAPQYSCLLGVVRVFSFIWLYSWLLGVVWGALFYSAIFVLTWHSQGGIFVHTFMPAVAKVVFLFGNMLAWMVLPEQSYFVGYITAPLFAN